MTFEPIFQPDKRKRGPQPAKVDLHVVFLIGTTIWIIISLIVFLLRKQMGVQMVTITLLTCAFGVITGFLLLSWESINRSHYTKLAGGAHEDGSFGITDETGLPPHAVLASAHDEKLNNNTNTAANKAHTPTGTQTSDTQKMSNTQKK